MPEDRWDRLESDIKAAGIDCTLHRRTGPYGCGPKAEITITEGDLKVVISDKWWNKNIDVWVGWQVCVENREGITLGRPSRWTKKRSETLENVRNALRNLDSA